MRARIMPLTDANTEFIDAWRNLTTRSEPNPFFAPEAVLPAARYLDGGGEVALLLVEAEGRPVFLAPVRSQAAYRRLPVRTLSTWVHEYCYLGTPLLDPGHPEAVDVAVAHVRTNLPETWWSLPLLAGDGTVATRLRAAGAEATVLRTLSRAVLRHHHELDYADGRISGRHLKNLRRQQRNLAREMNRDVFVHDAAEPDGMPLDMAIDELLRIEASGWKGEQGTAMLRRVGHADFFRELCHGFAARGDLQLLIYGSDERAAAGLCNLVSNGVAFSFKIAFDDALARHSPGTYLDVAMIGIFHEQERFDLLDSCTTPGATPSDQLYPDRRPLLDALMPIAGPASRMTAAGAGHLFRTLDRRRSTRAG